MTFKPFSEEKVWGRVMHVFANPHAAVSCLEVERGYCCSKHKHFERANLFAVQTGAIVVEVWDEGSQEPDMVLLGTGDVFTVPSGVLHRFRVLTDGRVTEVYWPDVEGGVCRYDDIEREDEGGEDDVEELKAELIRQKLI